MGHSLYRMLRHGMPDDWSPGERLVALIVADICDDKTHSGWISNKRLCTETGYKTKALSDVLRRLAGRGYEVRVIHGYGKDGRPVYAARGHSTDYRVPILPPRPVAVDKPRKVPSARGLSERKGPVETAERSGPDGIKARSTPDPLPSSTPAEPLNATPLLTEPHVEGNGAAPVQDRDLPPEEGQDGDGYSGKHRLIAARQAAEARQAREAAETEARP
jgi:hypothetical protein